MNKRWYLFLTLGFTLIWLAFALPILLSPLGGYPVIDAAWHSAWASEVAGGDPLVYAPYFRAPLYPLALGLVFFLSGGSAAAGVVFSFLLGTVSLLVIYRTVLDLQGGRKAAIAAALLTGINGVFLFYTTTLLITPLYIFLLVLSFYLFQGSRPSKYGWLTLGLAAVARPSAVILFPLAMVLYRKNWKYSWLFLLPVCSVWAVNWSAGDPGTVISSQGGINFYIGSGPGADGYTSFAPLTEGTGSPTDSLPYVDNVWSSSLRPFPPGTRPSRISAEWTRRTLGYMGDNPGASVSLFSRKLLYLVSPVAIPSNYDVYYYARYSPLAGILAGTPEFPVAGLLLWLLLPGAVAAGRLALWERNALLWSAALALGILPFFVTARFLLPVFPFMVILLAPRCLKKPVRSLLLAPLGLAAGLGLAQLTADTVSSGGVNMAFHDGLAHYQEGLVEKSEALLLLSLNVALERNDGIDLNGTDALFNLGILALRRGDADDAETYWRLAVERNPGFTPAVQALQGLTR